MHISPLGSQKQDRRLRLMFWNAPFPSHFPLLPGQSPALPFLRNPDFAASPFHLPDSLSFPPDSWFLPVSFFPLTHSPLPANRLVLIYAPPPVSCHRMYSLRYVCSPSAPYLRKRPYSGERCQTGLAGRQHCPPACLYGQQLSLPLRFSLYGQKPPPASSSGAGGLPISFGKALLWPKGKNLLPAFHPDPAAPFLTSVPYLRRPLPPIGLPSPSHDQRHIH